MKLEALPAFSDNYIWMLHDGRQAIVVDPGDATPVQAALEAQGLAPTQILVTLNLAGHVAAVAALTGLRPGKPFMRRDVTVAIQSTTQRVAAGTRGRALLGALREWKNKF